MKTPLAALAGLTMLTAIGVSPSLAQTNLTMWMYGECPPDTCIDRALVDAFQAANPDITIDLIQQPPDGYFTTLLTSSAISRGPDIAVMWAGRYMTDFLPYMTDIHDYVPAEIVDQAAGAQYYSANNTKGVVYAAPLASQWYIGFYNKKLFAEAGITALPTTWTELMDASKSLKDKGIQPIIVGPGGGAAQFQPLYEWSYLASIFPPADWGKLIEGSMPYANPQLESQLTHWNELYAAGYINEDAFNYPTAIEDFEAGKAAMFLGNGSWTATRLTAALGDDLGIIVPPYNEAGAKKSLIALAGGGYTVMTYSQHKAEAGKFINFVLSDEGQKVVAKFDAPTRDGFPTQNKLLNELIAMTASGNYSIYPMFDNFTQPPVTDAIYRHSALVLVGQEAPAAALAAVDEAVASLPEDQKTPGFNFEGK